MITKLLPNQISASWPMVKDLLYRNHPPEVIMNEQTLASVFKAAMMGGLQVWVIHDSDFEDNTSKIKAIGITTITVEPITRTRSLLIYALVSNYSLGDDRIDYMKELEVIRKYAKAKDCEGIIAYSDVPAVLSLVKSLGGNTSIRFIKLEV